MIKRIVMLLIAWVFVLNLCACSNGGAGAEKSPESGLTYQDYYDLGVRYLSEGNYEEAIIAFTAAIEIDPMRPEAYVGLANAYVGVDNYEKAREVISEAQTVCGDLEIFYAWLENLEGSNSEFQQESFSKEENAVLQHLMENFANDDIEGVKAIVRSSEFLAICKSMEESSRSELEFDFGHTMNGTGIHVIFDKWGQDRIECYYGTWHDGLLDGEGIYCWYWPPYDDPDGYWPPYEDWTITHATWVNGLVDGYCERVRETLTRRNGSNEVENCVDTVSGMTSRGFWNGHITQTSIYGDGYDMYSYEGDVVNGRTTERYGPDNTSDNNLPNPVTGSIGTMPNDDDWENYRQSFIIRSLAGWDSLFD